MTFHHLSHIILPEMIGLICTQAEDMSARRWDCSGAIKESIFDSPLALLKV